MEGVRETAGITLRAILQYVRAQGGDEAVREVLLLAGETEDASAYEDTRRWWSYRTKINLFDAAARVLGEPDVAGNVGRSILRYTLHAPLRIGLLMVGGPAQIMKLIAKTSSKFNAAADMSALSTGPGNATLEYRLRTGHTPSQYDCDYTRGLLTQIPVLFGLAPATVDHEICQVRGAPACIYEVTWRQRSLWSWLRRARTVDRSVGDVIAAQLTLLQNTVAELVGAQQGDRALAVVAERASSALDARAFLLVARPGLDKPSQVHGFGLSEAEIAAVVAEGHPGAESANRAGRGRYASSEPAGSEPGRVVVDIVSGLRYYGYVVAYFDHVLAFERRLLEAYANLAAVALDSLCALETAAERQQVAEQLLALARSLTFASTSEEVAAVTTEAAHAVMRADSAAVMLINAEGALRVVAHRGFADEHARTLAELTISGTDTERFAPFMAGEPGQRVYDKTTSDPFIRGVLQAFRLDHVAVVSIRLPERTYGILVAGFNGEHGGSRSHQFTERMTGIADQAATVLRTCELLNQTWQQAHTDALTGLANRRAFMTSLNSAVAGDGCLLFIDLDHFKTVNDTLGHGAGDELLAVTAQRLLAVTRRGDVVARLGGDEFVVLSPGRATLAELDERIRTAFVEPVSLAGSLVPVRASIGGTAFRAGDAAEDVLSRADAAMYDVKRSRDLRSAVPVSYTPPAPR